MNNYFKQLIEEPVTGLKIIVGTLAIHLVEGEQASVRRLLRNINQHMHGTTPFYNSCWVLHFVDEQPTRIFNQWFCKSVAMGGNGKSLKDMSTQMDKAWTIYDAMSDIGRQLTAKGFSTATHQPSQITQFVKSLANDSIPIGDDLLSAAGDSEMTLNEFLQFVGEPPDILLEKELVWPVEPDLMY